jgi:hypothetical protein
MLVMALQLKVVLAVLRLRSSYVKKLDWHVNR